MSMKELFFNLLGEELSKEKFYRKGNKFLKKEGANEYIYNIDGSTGFLSFEPDFAILIESVEDIKKKAWGKSYRKFVSVGRTKRYLLPKEQSDQCWSWTDTEAAVFKAVSKEMEFYHSFLKQYYEQYSNINFLDELLNSEPHEHRVIAYNNIQTSFLAVIVAYLTENSKLPELIPFYKAVVQKFNKEYLPEFEMLEKHLTIKV